MILSERHIIKPSHKHFNELDHLCFLSKNLYNQGLYQVRQHFFDTKKYLSYPSLDKKLNSTLNVDYKALPAKVSQQTLKLIDQNFRSFFSSLKSENMKNKKKSIPSYIDKDGRFIVVYTDQALSKRWLKQGFINPSKTNIFIPTKQKNIKQTRVIHRGSHIVVEVLYEQKEKEQILENGRYASIDMGVNNLICLTSNCIKPLLINGRPLKSINSYFNKQKTKIQSKNNSHENKKADKKLKKLFLKRSNKINFYLHKASRVLVNHLTSNNICRLVIGYNKEWKKDINIGKRNNQNFVYIPHAKLIDMISYKCKLQGIDVVMQEESYTSKCSFLDNEEIKKHQTYKGKRISRGLFKTSTKRFINADVNASLNILKKGVKNAFEEHSESDLIKVCSAPLVLTIKPSGVIV